jgi:hypothetical protein
MDEIDMTQDDRGIDVRPQMEYEVAYGRTPRGTCTFCKNEGETLTKHHWAHRPKGHLITRCTQHAAKHERR